MKIKILGIFVCMLLIATIFPTIVLADVNKLKEVNNIVIEKEETSIYNNNNIKYMFDKKADPVQDIITDDKTERGEVLDQSHNQTGKWGWGVTSLWWIAQGFKPTLKSLTKVKLWYFRVGNPSDDIQIIVSIRDDLYGNDIVSTSVNAGQIVDQAWIEADFPDITIIPEQMYYIVCSATGGEPGNVYCWFYDINNPYTRGDAWGSPDLGYTWILLDNPPDSPQTDCCFKTYGIKNTNLVTYGSSKDIMNAQNDEIIHLNNGVHIFDNQEDSSKNDDWWSMFHHDPQLRGFSTSIAPMTNNLLWTYTSGYYFNGFSSPAVVDNRLYLGSSYFVYFHKNTFDFIEYVKGEKNPVQNKGNNYLNKLSLGEGSQQQDIGFLHCLNAASGTEVWEFYTEGYSVSSPAVVDNRVYISSVYEYEQVGNFYCLDATTGDEIWSSSLFSPFSSPIVAEDKLYVSAIELAGDDFIGKIFCLNVLNGNEIWNYTIGIGEYLFLSTPAVAYGNVYFVTRNETEGVPGHIFCLDANTGDVNWKSSIWSMLNSPVLSYNNIYISSYDTTNNRGIFLCLDAEDGDEKWRYNMGIEEFPSYTTPAVAYGNIYFTTLDALSYRAKIFCINASTGNYVWARTPGDMMFMSSPAVADEKVYLASNLYGNLYCFDSFDGTTIWSYSLDFETYSSPAIADDTLYIADGGTIYAFQDVNIKPNPPSISGLIQGRPGIKYDYHFVSTDPNGDEIYYYIDWDDGSNTGWIGPYNSGVTIAKEHRWITQGTYIIKAKAKDTTDLESEWGELEVNMPRNKSINIPVLNWLQNHPNIFPILQLLLQRLGL